MGNQVTFLGILGRSYFWEAWTHYQETGSHFQETGWPFLETRSHFQETMSHFRDTEGDPFLKFLKFLG